MNTHCKISNIKYKNVISNVEGFAKNEVQLKLKADVDMLCGGISEPTGYIIAVFGKDTNQDMARTWHFGEACPVGAWHAASILKDSV